MPVEVIMPKVDMDMTTGKLSVWHVAEGETVEKGAALFDIETDKAAMEVESPASGQLRHIQAAPGQVVAVGAPMAWIYAVGEAVGAAPGAAVSPAIEAVGEPAEKAPSTPAPTPSPEAEGTRGTPAARRLARATGIALEALVGTGPRGRIQRADVENQHVRDAPPTLTLEPAAPEILPGVWRADTGDLHISRRKGTGTPLLLIHGFAADAMGWAPLERALPADLPLIHIELPNHGRSPRRKIRDFPALARSVVEAFDRADAEKVHLMGHSLGGAVALAIADIRPRQVASLTLIAPAGLGPEIDGAALTGIARASRAESLAPWLKRLTATPDGISWEFAQAAMLTRTDPTLRAAQLDMAEALFPDGTQAFDLHAALARVTAPAAILWGRSDRILPWRQALAARGDMALHLLEKTGHIPHVECPEIVAGILMRQIGQAPPR